VKEPDVEISEDTPGGGGVTGFQRIDSSQATALPVADERFLSSGTIELLGEIRGLIEEARSGLAQVVNVRLVTLYWSIGNRIRRDVVGEARAEYGKKVVLTLSERLTAEYGRGFGEKNLFHMMRFAEVFPDPQIVSALCRQLGWAHFREIMYLKEPIQREFYAEMCRVERWSVRNLRERINSMLYERTALSRKPAQVVGRDLETLRRDDVMTPDLVFRDPYVLDFLGLADVYSERDLESAILSQLEGFLLELGSDFTFVARQKRMSVGNEDFHLDLLFYHRSLRRLVAIELKLGAFSAAYKGQMELYLRWLEKNEMRPGEESPLGLILCSEKNQEQIELLRLDHGEIRVAEYLTELPQKPVLEARLHEAVRQARERLAAPQRPEEMTE
jgi:predicted nuclease of restriction endonuclease-like (RecB) superfamily